MSSACRSRMHDVCRGYTDGYETYRCECRCHVTAEDVQEALL